MKNTVQIYGIGSALQEFAEKNTPKTAYFYPYSLTMSSTCGNEVYYFLSRCIFRGGATGMALPTSECANAMCENLAFMLLQTFIALTFSKKRSVIALTFSRK